MVSRCQRDGFSNRELEVDHLGWNAAAPPLDCGPSEDGGTVSALSRHELASTPCSHLGWFTPKGRDRLGSCRSPVAVSAPEDAWVRLWSGIVATLVGVAHRHELPLAAAARAEHAGGRAVHVPVGVLEGASGICGHAGRTWAQRGRWGRMEEGTG